ncbi:phage tail protein [Desulfovibrio cuneatus]|uniref:phage tail protein n=1 Tax=Desulfovibrio cuneatus TaxID=159728 RepID=UPI0003FB0752|nr:phage tail protein [Desulfovibrio cuneatus]
MAIPPGNVTQGATPQGLPLPALPIPPFFWQWFCTVLRWPFLLMGGPIACLCAGIASAADHVLADVRWFVNQWNPATCEKEYVDRFGAARGLTRHWRETEEMWRRRVCAAMAWHKLAGRTLGMPQILAHYGYTGSVIINRAEEGEEALWAHFRCEFGGEYPITDEDYELIKWVLNTTKPAKSILESSTLILKPKATLYIAAAMVAGQVVTIAPWVRPIRTAHNSTYLHLGWQAWNIYTIQPLATLGGPCPPNPQQGE